MFTSRACPCSYPGLSPSPRSSSLCTDILNAPCPCRDACPSPSPSPCPNPTSFPDPSPYPCPSPCLYPSPCFGPSPGPYPCPCTLVPTPCHYSPGHPPRQGLDNFAFVGQVALRTLLMQVVQLLPLEEHDLKNLEDHVDLAF
ncbi:hypothetical protein E2C01_023517 [Portunus trituberculatus]|uniref:Uncharacterized protein n=1 Tax=Portunus trituberculatus TaxID=210409 RepID=A0A5B7EAR4_PORTR|nr:hypothetical protein [Portunus trituberculatus]